MFRSERVEAECGERVRETRPQVDSCAEKEREERGCVCVLYSTATPQQRLLLEVLHSTSKQCSHPHFFDILWAPFSADEFIAQSVASRTVRRLRRSS